MKEQRASISMMLLLQDLPCKFSSTNFQHFLFNVFAHNLLIGSANIGKLQCILFETSQRLKYRWGYGGKEETTVVSQS